MSPKWFGAFRIMTLQVAPVTFFETVFRVAYDERGRSCSIIELETK